MSSFLYFRKNIYKITSYIRKSDSVYLLKDVVFSPASVGHFYSDITPDIFNQVKPPPVRLWKKRLSLWSKFDMGIKMDPDAWFEMTPENVSRYLAWRLRKKQKLFDACSGVGSNAIQFSKLSDSVIGIDTNPHRVEMSLHNAGIYNCTSRLHFETADVMEFLSGLSECDKTKSCLHISPPWGGKECYQKPVIDLDGFPIRLTPLIELAMNRVGAVVVHLPRNTNIDDIVYHLGRMGIKYFEIERIFYSSPTKRLKFYYLYIDTSFDPQHTIYSSVLDLCNSSLSRFVGSRLGPTIIREAYLNLSVLGVRLCGMLAQYKSLNGVFYEPVNKDIALGLPETLALFTTNLKN